MDNNIEITDIEEEYHIIRVICKGDIYGEPKIFHIITSEGDEDGFYCPICHEEYKRIRSDSVSKHHEVKILGTISVGLILDVLKAKGLITNEPIV